MGEMMKKTKLFIQTKLQQIRATFCTQRIPPCHFWHKLLIKPCALQSSNTVLSDCILRNLRNNLTWIGWRDIKIPQAASPIALKKCWLDDGTWNKWLASTNYLRAICRPVFLYWFYLRSLTVPQSIHILFFKPILKPRIHYWLAIYRNCLCCTINWAINCSQPLFEFWGAFH